MKKVGIIGKGYFGQKIKEKLEDFTEIVFITGKELEGITFDIDWAIIASSTPSHFDLAMMFLKKGVNVFVEKPMTTSYGDSKKLVEEAEKQGVKLYVDDVFMWHPVTKEIKEVGMISELTFYWGKYGSFKDTIYSNLTYHDLYLALYFTDGKLGASFPKMQVNRINEKIFTLGKVKFVYNRLSKVKDKHVTVNGGDIFRYHDKCDPLREMLEKVIAEEVDFKENNERSLHTQYLLDILSSKKPRVAVVGAGIFGITTAMKLQQDFKVTLIEQNDDILQNASSINQYRLHRGYHYPRSIETALSAKKGTDNFLKVYPCERTPSPTSFYAIPKKESKVTPKEFEEFMNKVELSSEKDHQNNLFSKEIDTVYSVEETVFDPKELYSMCLESLAFSNIEIKFNTKFRFKDISDYDYVINCTYAGLNEVVGEERIYQYEVCEKPVVKLPERFANMSIVIIDGPFMCIDPYSDTDYHVMGNVVHAIHRTEIGTEPVIPREIEPLLNKGVIENPPVTKIEKFKESAARYLNIKEEEIEHIGSMYTVRTVLPNHDHDDARPSLIEKHAKHLFSIFSGKISTAVDTADQLHISLMKG